MKSIAKILLSFALIVMGLDLMGQSTATLSPAELYRQKYTQALRYNDVLSAKDAALTLVAIGELTFRDSLMTLYFGLENYASAYLVAKELSVKSPEKPEILEVLATCEQRLGLGMEALTHYATLVRVTKNVYFQYQMATLQYSLDRKDEAKRTIEEILLHPDALKVPVFINYDANTGQEVPAKAAALNLKGAIFAEEGNDPIAIASLNEALGIKRDFVLARENLSGLTAQIKKKAEQNAAKAAENQAPAGNN